MKKLTKSIALVAIAAIAGVNVYIMNESNKKMSDLSLSNIDADAAINWAELLNTAVGNYYYNLLGPVAGEAVVNLIGYEYKWVKKTCVYNSGYFQSDYYVASSSSFSVEAYAPICAGGDGGCIFDPDCRPYIK